MWNQAPHLICSNSRPAVSCGVLLLRQPPLTGLGEVAKVLKPGIFALSGPSKPAQGLAPAETWCKAFRRWHPWRLLWFFLGSVSTAASAPRSPREDGGSEHQQDRDPSIELLVTGLSSRRYTFCSDSNTKLLQLPLSSDTPYPCIPCQWWSLGLVKSKRVLVSASLHI